MPAQSPALALAPALATMTSFEDASRLVLVKPADDLAEPVDRAFASVVPAGLPVAIVGWARLEAALSP